MSGCFLVRRSASRVRRSQPRPSALVRLPASQPGAGGRSLPSRLRYVCDGQNRSGMNDPEAPAIALATTAPIRPCERSLACATCEHAKGSCSWLAVAPDPAIPESRRRSARGAFDGRPRAGGRRTELRGRPGSPGRATDERDAARRSGLHWVVGVVHVRLIVGARLRAGASVGLHIVRLRLTFAVLERADRCLSCSM